MNSLTQRSAFDEPAAIAGNSPIDDLEDLIASSFAGEISAATPRVCIILQDQFNKCADAEDKDILPYAARMLLDRRELLAMQIDHSLRQRFDAKLDCPGDSVSHIGQFSKEALQLIEELGMQEEFELEQCVNRLREQCQPELFRLTTCMCRLLGHNTLSEARNPAFPRVLLCALRDALTHIGCDVRTRRLVFRTYSPLLPKIITDLYARANAMLAIAGHGAAVEFADRRRNRPAAPLQILAMGMR